MPEAIAEFIIDQYILYLNYQRGKTLSSAESAALANFLFDQQVFSMLLQQSDELHQAFYNREITINLHTDGPVGHASGHLPVLNHQGDIITAYNIGLDPKMGEPLFNKIFGAKGEVSEQARSHQEKALLSAKIRMTEEQYIKLAQLIREDIDNPPTYRMHGLEDSNCIYWLDRKLQQIGIIDGLKNKFSYAEFQKINFRLIKWQAEWFFDEFHLELYKLKMQSAFDLHEYQIELRLIQQQEAMLEKARAAKQKQQHTSDIMHFANQMQKINSDTAIQMSEMPAAVTGLFEWISHQPKPTTRTKPNPLAEAHLSFEQMPHGKIGPTLTLPNLLPNMNSKISVDFSGYVERKFDFLIGDCIYHKEHEYAGQKYLIQVKSTGRGLLDRMSGCKWKVNIRNLVTKEKHTQHFSLQNDKFYKNENQIKINEQINQLFTQVVEHDITQTHPQQPPPSKEVTPSSNELSLKKMLLANQQIQQLTGPAINMVANFANRSGYEALQNTMQYCQLAPNAVSMISQLPRACYAGQVEDWRQGAKSLLAKHSKAIFHPLGSLSKSTRCLDLGYSLLQLTPLAKACPHFNHYLGQVVSTSKLLTTANKAYKAYKLGKSLADFSTFAVEQGVNGMYGLVHYLAGDKGNLPEDVEYYYAQDAVKWFALGFIPPNPITPWYFLGQTIYNHYLLFSGEYHERAYQAMMQNATYFLRTGDLLSADTSIRKLRQALDNYYDGLNYSDKYSPIVRQVKVFVFHYQLQQTFTKFSTQRKNSNAFPQQEANIIENLTRIDATSPLSLQDSHLPVHLVPTALLYRWQVTLANPLIDAETFYREFSLVEEALRRGLLEGEALANFKHHRASILQVARNRFIYLAFNYYLNDAVKAQAFLRIAKMDVPGHQPWSQDLEPMAFYCLGSMALQQGEVDQAIQYFDAIAIADKDKCWQIWYEVGVAIDQLRQKTQNQFVMIQLSALLEYCIKQALNYFTHQDELAQQEKLIFFELELAHAQLKKLCINERLQKLQLDAILTECATQSAWYPLIQTIYRQTEVSVLKADKNSENKFRLFSTNRTGDHQIINEDLRNGLLV